MAETTTKSSSFRLSQDGLSAIRQAMPGINACRHIQGEAMMCKTDLMNLCMMLGLDAIKLKYPDPAPLPPQTQREYTQ